MSTVYIINFYNELGRENLGSRHCFFLTTVLQDDVLIVENEENFTRMENLQ